MSEQLKEDSKNKIKKNRIEQIPRSYYIYQTITNNVENVNNQKMEIEQQNDNNSNKRSYINNVNAQMKQQANQRIIIKEQQNNQMNNSYQRQQKLKFIADLQQQQNQLIPYIGRNPCTFIYDDKLYILGQGNQSQQTFIQNKVNNMRKASHQQQQQFLASSIKQSQSIIAISYYDLNTSKCGIQILSIINLQLIQRSYQIQSFLLRNRQSTPAQSTRNRQPKLYYPNHLQNVSCCQLLGGGSGNNVINNNNNNKHIVYLFGGVYRESLQYSNVMWRVNLKDKTIQMVKQQGEQIQAREAATLISYNNYTNGCNKNNSNNWLILYGGYNITTCTVYNDFYCFNTTNSTWYIIQTDFENLLTPRIHPTITYNPSSNKFYLFGGLLHDYNGNQKLLNDMYQLTLEDIDNINGQRKSKKYKGLLTSKTILPKIYDEFPSRRAGHKCTWVNDYTLLIIGGEKQFQLKKYQQQNMLPQQSLFLNRNYLNDIWIFDTKLQKWSQILPQNTQTLMKQNAHFGLEVIKKNGDGIYECLILGGENMGLSDNNLSNNGLSRLKIDMRLYQQWQKEKVNQNSLKQHQCGMCIQQTDDIYIDTNNNNGRGNTFPANQVDAFILNGMKFPFTAFGILTHYSIQRQSSLVAITYRQYLQTTLYPNQITIQDDSFLQYKAHEVNSKIHLLGNKDMTDILGVNEKKYKSMHLREYNLIQFCNLFKMAGLRLGEEIFWIAGNNHKETLVFLLRKEKIYYNNNKDNKNGDNNNKTNNDNKEINNKPTTIDLDQTNNNNQKPQQQTTTTQNQQYKQVYRSYFYAICSQKHKLLPGYSQQVRTQIMKSYHLTIKHFVKERQCTGSIMRIKKLRKITVLNQNKQKVQKLQLTPLVEKNAIIIQNQLYNNMKNQQLKSLAYQQSIDINLSAYLSVLFLNRVASIMLKVNSIIPPKPAITQATVLNNNNKPKEQIKNPKYINLVVEDQSSQKNKQKLLQQKQKQKQNDNKQGQNVQDSKQIVQNNKQVDNNNKKQIGWKNNSFVSNVVKYIQTHPKQTIIEKNKSSNCQNKQSIEGVPFQLQQGKNNQQVQKQKQKQIDGDKKQDNKNYINDKKQIQCIQILDQSEEEEIQQKKKQQDKEKQKQKEQKQKEQGQKQKEKQQKKNQIIQLQVQAQIKEDKQKQKYLNEKQKQLNEKQKDEKQKQNEKDKQNQQKNIQMQAQVEIQKQQQQKQQPQQQQQSSITTTAKQPTKQPQPPITINVPAPKQPTQPQARQIINSFNQIPPQFMLPKIDLLKAKQELMQIDLDAFGEFQCRIIEVYFWKNKDSYFNDEENYQKEKQNDRQKGNQNIISQNNTKKIKQYQPPLLFPNGLLIYHKNRLIKRYYPPFGIFNPFLKTSVSNLIGVIEISQKIPINMFNTGFINEEIQLQKLYSRIEHVAYLYNKMYPKPVQKRQRPKEDDQKNEDDKDKKVSNSEKENNEMVNLSVVNNQEIVQKIQGTKRIKQQ